jgi:hypothetical protein
MSGPLDRVTTVEIDEAQLPLPVSVSGLTTDTDAVTLANLATNYTAAGVEVLSQIFSTNGKQRIRVALQITKTLNPTDILVKLYTHSDTGSVDKEHHQEDFWADLRLSAASVGAGTYPLSLTAWCIAPACQVGVTASGVDGANFFTIAKPRAYLL